MPDIRYFTLALQEGFENDEVVISAIGMPTERLEQVSTRMQIGLAREVALAVPAGAGSLTIALPGRGISETVALPAGGEAHLGVSLDSAGRALAVRCSAEPFGYV